MTWIYGPFSFSFLLAATIAAGLTTASLGVWLARRSSRVHFRRRMRGRETATAGAAGNTAHDIEAAKHRIGARLHDGPAQHLSFVLMRLDEIEEALQAPSPSNAAALKTVTEIRDATENALSEIRTMSTELRKQ